MTAFQDVDRQPRPPLPVGPSTDSSTGLSAPRDSPRSAAEGEGSGSFVGATAPPTSKRTPKVTRQWCRSCGKMRDFAYSRCAMDWWHR